MEATLLKVLIVDDTLLVVQRLTEMISELKCVLDVKSATGYDEAIGLMSTFKPDIALLDIHLKEKNGIELLDFVKQNHPYINAIMLTNQASENYKVLCQKMGADYFVDKSSEFEKIPAIIESYYDKKLQQL